MAERTKAIVPLALSSVSLEPHAAQTDIQTEDTFSLQSEIAS